MLGIILQQGLIHREKMHDSHTNVPLAKIGDFGMTVFIQRTGLCTKVPSMKFDILSFGALVTEIMSKQYMHVSATEQIDGIIRLLDNPLVSIIKCCFQEDCLTADILTMRIAKQTIAYTGREIEEQGATIKDLQAQSFQVQSQTLESADARLQRSCDAVLDRTHNIIYLRQGMDRKLFVFNLSDNTWKDLIDCNLLQCALVFFDGNLLAIGGAKTDESPHSSEVYKLVEDTQSHKWENTQISLNIARGRSTALA